jgi:gliding motility-associated-like protein
MLGTVPLPLADAGSLQNLDCDTDLVSIGGSGTTSGDEFTYQWTGPGINTNNQSTATPNVTMPGTYTLQVTNQDYGCLSAPATVEVVDLSYVPQVVLEVLDILDCATGTVQIDARDWDEGNEFVYQWLDGNLNPIPGENGLLISVNTAQFYTLQILDTLTGCDNAGTVEVEENELYPLAEAGLSQLITCGDPIATLDGTASQMGGQINYQWTSPSGFSIAGSTTNLATTTEPGWYFLEVLDELNGCSNIDSVFVSEDTEYPLAFTSEGLELDCNVTNTLITSEGSSQGSIFSYQWLLNGNPIANATQQQLNAVQAGVYTLQVINTSNECVSTALTEITSNPAAPQALEFATDIPTCAGDDDGAIFLTGVQGGTPPFLYSVGGAPFTYSTNYSNLTAGNYPITIEDATGCLLLTTVTVQDGNDLTLELGDDQVIKEGELVDIYPEISVDSAQLVQIDWQTAATLPCEDCIYQFDVEVPESMRFFLSIQDINGCEASDDLTIYVEKERPIYVPTAFSPNNDGENDIFHIYSDQSVVKINSFLVFNRWGESVFEVYNSFPNDPRWGWDGNYRGLPVNSAVYVWFAEVEFSNGDVEVIKGEVSVMR